MDKINELIAWFALAIGWWLYKSDCPNNDNGEQEIPAVVDMASSGIQQPVSGQFQNAQLHDDSIITLGLSDLMMLFPAKNVRVLAAEAVRFQLM